MKNYFLFFLLLYLVCNSALAQQLNINDVFPYTLDEVDVKPKFPGGDDKLTKFLNNNLVYDSTAIENEIEGYVKSTFVIDTKGKPTNIIINQSLGPVLDSEVIRIIKLMPNWKPARINGIAVPCIYYFPVQFKLMDFMSNNLLKKSYPFFVPKYAYVTYPKVILKQGITNLSEKIADKVGIKENCGILFDLSLDENGKILKISNLNDSIIDQSLLLNLLNEEVSFQPAKDYYKNIPSVINCCITNHKRLYNFLSSPSNLDSIEYLGHNYLNMDTSIKIYRNLKNAASFKGGEKALARFLTKNLNFERDFIPENSKECMIFVEFIVDIEGNILQPKILYGCTKAGHEEALRIIKLMPKWEPANINNIPVASYVQIPLGFSISDN
jgi:hypothetical protein